MKVVFGKNTMPIDFDSLPMFSLPVNTLFGNNETENDKASQVWNHILNYYNLRDQYLDAIRGEYYKTILKRAGFKDLDNFIFKAVEDYYYNNKTIDELTSEYEKDGLTYIPLRELIRIAIIRRWIAILVTMLDNYLINGEDFDLIDPPDVLKHS